MCVSGIYTTIYTRIDSLFKAGERTLDFLTKRPTRTRICRALRDVKAIPWKAAFGAARRFDELFILIEREFICVVNISILHLLYCSINKRVQRIVDAKNVFVVATIGLKTNDVSLMSGKDAEWVDGDPRMFYSFRNIQTVHFE